MPCNIEKIIPHTCYYLQFVIGRKKSVFLVMHSGACTGYLNRKEYFKAFTVWLPLKIRKCINN